VNAFDEQADRWAGLRGRVQPDANIQRLAEDLAMRLHGDLGHAFGVHCNADGCRMLLAIARAYAPQSELAPRSAFEAPFL
jgi:hypothetical protein